MIDANTLLNPKFSDSKLRAYAYLSTQYRHGVRSPVDCLQPFVIHAIAAFAGNQLDWKSVISFLKENYGLTVPFYMLERMHGRLVEAGALHKSDISKLFIFKDARPTLNAENVDLSTGDIEYIGEELSRFAKLRSMPSPATASKWSDIIIPFFQHKSPPNDKNTADIRGVLVSDPKSVDFTVVADFIVEEHRLKTPNFRIIEQIYYGVLVADFLTQVETAGNKTAFSGLGILYDTPVILRLLGLSGKVLQEATIDLHETLRDLKCRMYYFHHTYDELVAVIDGNLRAYESKRPLNRELQEAIANREISISEVYAIRAELDIRLSSQIGLVEHAAGYDNRSLDDYQIDENAFRIYLQKYRAWGSHGPTTVERDAMSLALTLRLRNGKQARDVSKAGFVFVTQNIRLATMSRRFLVEQDHIKDGVVGPIMTVGQISTIAWVVNEVFYDEKKITKELIANCYSASLPDDDFDRVLEDVFKRTNANLASEIYDNAFVLQSVRQVALSQTAGHSALIRTLNTSELLAEAENVRHLALTEARQQERTLTKESIESEQRLRMSQRARKLSAFIAKLIILLLFSISVYVILRTQGIIGVKPVKGDIIFYGAIVIALYELADFFGVISTASLRKVIDKAAYWGIGTLQQTLM